MTDKVLQKYAELIVKCGVNVQKGQYVIIEADIERAAALLLDDLRSGRLGRVSLEKPATLIDKEENENGI